MSVRSMKACIALALVVAALVGASSASASWTTNGVGNFAASPGAVTNGPSLLTLANGIGITCSASGGSGALAASQSSGNGLATIVPLFTGCKVGSFTAVARCDAASVNAVSYSAPTTTGTITGISCRIVVPPIGCGEATNITSGFLVTGGIPNVTYGNTSQQLILPVAHQTLSVAYQTACGTGSPQPALFSNITGGATIYTITSTFRPRISNP